MEIYCSQLHCNIYPDGISFRKIVEVAYTEYNTIIFALEIQSKPQDGKIPSSIIRLNPVDFQFHWIDFNTYVYKLHMICDDSDQALKVETLEEMTDERYERVFADKDHPNLQRCKEKNKTQLTKPNELEDENKNLLKIPNPVKEPPVKKDTSGILKNGKSSTTHHQNKQTDNDTELDMLYDRLPKPQTQMEVGEEHLL